MQGAGFSLVDLIAKDLVLHKVPLPRNISEVDPYCNCGVFKTRFFVSLGILVLGTPRFTRRLLLTGYLVLRGRAHVHLHPSEVPHYCTVPVEA